MLVRVNDIESRRGPDGSELGNPIIGRISAEGFQIVPKYAFCHVLNVYRKAVLDKDRLVVGWFCIIAELLVFQ